MTRARRSLTDLRGGMGCDQVVTTRRHRECARSEIDKAGVMATQPCMCSSLLVFGCQTGDWPNPYKRYRGQLRPNGPAASAIRAESCQSIVASSSRSATSTLMHARYMWPSAVRMDTIRRSVISRFGRLMAAGLGKTGQPGGLGGPPPRPISTASPSRSETSTLMQAR